MSDVIRARDLMLTEFVRVRTDQTLGEGMAALREAQAKEGLPNALMVVDPDGKFVNMLTAKLLVRILVGSGAPGERFDDDHLLQIASGRLANRIGDALVVDVPPVTSDDRLLTMIRRGLPTRLDFVPVVDDGRPVGLAPITAIFQSAASIALTPEHEGIRFDR